jgi:hypothetical protein
MKKLFLAALCAGLFFACGNKKQAEQPETLIDTPVAQQPMVEPEQQVAEPVADEPVAQTTPAKKNNTTAKKNNTPSKAEQQGIQQVDNSSIKTHVEKSATNVANTAIDKAEKEATNTIVNSGKKKR